MGYIFVDREKSGGEEMRSQMRRNMRDGSYRHDGYMPMMRHESDYEHGYRMGYKHGWEDSDEDMEYRRARDSRGRFV